MRKLRLAVTLIALALAGCAYSGAGERSDGAYGASHSAMSSIGLAF